MGTHTNCLAIKTIRSTSPVGWQSQSDWLRDEVVFVNKVAKEIFTVRGSTRKTGVEPYLGYDKKPHLAGVETHLNKRYGVYGL